MAKNEEKHEHPSYAVLMFTRVSNGGPNRLFGSALNAHYGAIRLRIGSALLARDGYHDRIHGSGREFIEVEMSAAQFAEAITTMNVFPGTPCTIRRFNGEMIPPPPKMTTEAEHIKTNFREQLKQYVDDIHARRMEVDKLLDSQKISAKARDAIRIALDVMEYPLSSSAPFVLEQFNEATTRVSTAAKHEIDTFAQRVITSDRVLSSSDVAPQLTSGDENEGIDWSKAPPCDCGVAIGANHLDTCARLRWCLR